jgi:3-deoxy-D-manno-octulosonic-acid transferase
MAFFIKYEFWYNYLHILKHRQVPVYSVSSIFRPDQIFFRWYGRQYGRVLNCFTHFFVQNELSCQLLATIGIDNASVTGDTRFDRVLQIKEQTRQLPVVEAFINEGTSGKVFIAGSSWQPDEDIFIRYFREHPDWKLIIAPHVIDESHLQQIEQKLMGWDVRRYTKVLSRPVSTREGNHALNPHASGVGSALIIDCFGLLSSIYRYATVTYVGGGFGVGIHNTVEAAVWGVPVIFGPNNQRFQEAQELKGCNGGFEVSSYDDFCRLMDRFASDAEALRQAGEAAGGYVRHKAGATRMILDAVKL